MRARTALEAKGVTFVVEMLDSGVCHQAFFSDPDGNPLDPAPPLRARRLNRVRRLSADQARKARSSSASAAA